MNYPRQKGVRGLNVLVLLLFNSLMDIIAVWFIDIVFFLQHCGMHFMHCM